MHKGLKRVFLLINLKLNFSLDTQLVLQMKPKKFLLSLRIRSKVANLVMDYEECMTKPLKIAGKNKISKNEFGRLHKS